MVSKMFFDAASLLCVKEHQEHVLADCSHACLPGQVPVEISQDNIAIKVEVVLKIAFDFRGVEHCLKNRMFSCDWIQECLEDVIVGGALNFDNGHHGSGELWEKTDYRLVKNQRAGWVPVTGKRYRGGIQ